MSGDLKLSSVISNPPKNPSPEPGRPCHRESAPMGRLRRLLARGYVSGPFDQAGVDFGCSTGFR